MENKSPRFGFYAKAPQTIEKMKENRVELWVLMTFGVGLSPLMKSAEQKIRGDHLFFQQCFYERRKYSGSIKNEW